MAAERLIHLGHQVVLHARNEKRARDVLKIIPDAEAVLIADLANMEETKQLAADANALGRFDAVIHNAGINRGSGRDMFAVNTLAPYILTCLIRKPHRLIYLSSNMHLYGSPSLEPVTSGKGNISYSDSKFYVMLLMKAAARRWPDVYVNAVNPGWVPTKMGGSSAPDDLEKGVETQVWLAVSDDDDVKVSGRYFFHGREAREHPEVDNITLQDELLAACERITGIRFPNDHPWSAE